MCLLLLGVIVAWLLVVIHDTCIMSVTDVGVAVTDLQVVCEIITCVSAFTFTAEEVRHPCALRHHFYIPRPRSHIKLRDLEITYPVRLFKSCMLC